MQIDFFTYAKGLIYKFTQLDFFILKAAIDICPFDAEQLEIAHRAYRQYGKGRHPASLNYGDCFSYALAKQTGEPLLFKGNNFTGQKIEG